MHHYDQIVSSDAARHLTIVVEVERSCFDEASVSLELGTGFGNEKERLRTPRKRTALQEKPARSNSDTAIYLSQFARRQMADLNPSTTDAKQQQRILPASAAKVQRVSPSAPPSWSEECDRLLKTLGNDAKTLEQAEHALAAVAAGTVDAAALEAVGGALAADPRPELVICANKMDLVEKDALPRRRAALRLPPLPLRGHP